MVILHEMKTAVSIPDATFQKAESTARRLGVSRSRMYTLALEHFMDAEWNAQVTERLNEIYSSQSSELDPVLDAIQSVTHSQEDW